LAELRTVEEATHAMHLNGIPLYESPLRIQRPSKYAGAFGMAGDWNLVVGAGNFKAMQQQQNAALAAGGLSARLGLAEAPDLGPPSKVLKLTGMVGAEELEDETEYTEIVEDTRDECAKFGTILNVAIPRPPDEGVGNVFIEYENEEMCAVAAAALGGRSFGGNIVGATYYDAEKFASGHRV